MSWTYLTSLPTPINWWSIFTWIRFLPFLLSTKSHVWAAALILSPLWRRALKLKVLLLMLSSVLVAAAIQMPSPSSFGKETHSQQSDFPSCLEIYNEKLDLLELICSVPSWPMHFNHNSFHPIWLQNIGRGKSLNLGLKTSLPKGEMGFSSLLHKQLLPSWILGPIHQSEYCTRSNA